MSEMLTYQPDAWMNPPPCGVIERWLPVKKFEGKYEVSDKGRVRSLNFRRTGRVVVMKPSERSGCYMGIALMKNSKYHQIYVHTLVASAFLGEKPPGMFVNHKDGCKDNNSAENLEYVTRSENMRHACDLGLLVNKGESHSQSTVTEYVVRVIRRMKSKGLNLHEICEVLELPITTVRGIYYGKNWPEVKIE